jgi:hypothetical protein
MKNKIAKQPLIKCSGFTPLHLSGSINNIELLNNRSRISGLRLSQNKIAKQPRLLSCNGLALLHLSGLRLGQLIFILLIVLTNNIYSQQAIPVTEGNPLPIRLVGSGISKDTLLVKLMGLDSLNFNIGNSGGSNKLDSGLFVTQYNLDTVKNNRAFKNHPHEFDDIVGLSDSLNNIQVEILNLQNIVNTNINNIEPDTTAIAYTNRLLEEYLGYGTGYLFKCDTILKTESNFFTSIERDTTKRMIIDYLSIQTDSATIGYQISIKKLSTPTSSKIVFKNERLTGNVTVNFNLVGTPLVLQPDEHLYIQKILTNGEVKAKAWLTVKYRLK